MSVEDYWAAVKALGLRGPHRGSPDLDYFCTTRDGYLTQVTDPERLTPGERVEVVELLKARHGALN